MLLQLKKKYISAINPNTILFIAGICFICISSLFIWNELVSTKTYLLHRFNEKISSVEATLNSEIADAKHIIYGLGITVSEKSIISNHVKLHELIQNFDSRHAFDEEISTPLAGITFINADGTETIRTIMSNTNNSIKNKDYLDTKLCLAEREKEYFKVKVSPLRIGSGIKEQIIPINMSISDSNNNYLGTICSGLIVRELNKKLSLHFDSRYLESIKILNFNSSNNINNNDTNFYLKSLLNINFFNKNMLLTHKVQKYPFLLEAKLKHSFLKNAIYRFVLFSLCIFILFVVVIYFFSKNMRSYYERPLIPVQNKLDELNKINDRNRASLLNSVDVLEVKFSPAKLADSLNEFIASCYPLLLGQSEQTIEQNKLKKKILNLFFVEQHFMSLQKTKIGEDKLYINKLYGLINEEYITLPLYEFLEKLTHYCYEYYHEIGIKLIVEPQDRKSFTFKQTALIEAIFNIFTFILRSAFETGDNHLIMRASFVDNNDFPTITIEANINGCSDPLGWEVGPHFVHTSLLAIYLLAKENNLLFNIIKEGDTIFFILDPIQKKIEFYDLAII